MPYPSGTLLPSERTYPGRVSSDLRAAMNVRILHGEFHFGKEKQYFYKGSPGVKGSVAYNPRALTLDIGAAIALGGILTGDPFLAAHLDHDPYWQEMGVSF